MNRHMQSSQRRLREETEKGFSLIELLVVIAIILIIAAIAVPSLIKARLSANEASAASSARQISNAEGIYFSSWGTGFAVAITNLGGSTAACAAGASAANACLIDATLSVAPFAKSGYTFSATGTVPIGGINNGFEVTATPSMFRVTGQRAFCSDQPGIIRFDVNGAAPIAPPCSAVPTVPGVSGPIGN
ncbi:MAG TPA: prepilin-type N-terminal cleavage/methylation domain-containing protein [Candidatus Dormibacteraeota bacterium]|nr:prepilin-type N-terminal cleavage/methylation domain-containing protein [Candidatus Dormibacteraeota bacterium]